MVVTMFGRPPQHAFLRGALRQDRENELERSARRISAVREIAMISGTDCKDPKPVKRDADDRPSPRDAGPDRGKARGVNEQEGDGGRVDDVVVFAAGSIRVGPRFL